MKRSLVSGAAIAAARREMIADDQLKMLPAAWERLLGSPGGQTTGRLIDVLAAAHDPALGLDRSVCLRDVVIWLRENGEEQKRGWGYIDGADRVADEIEREFVPEGEA